MKLLVISCVIALVFIGCGPKAANFYTQGMGELNSYNCVAVDNFKKAADMEFEKEGNWYPIYMMSLGQGRYYCNTFPDALKAFQTIDQFVVLRSERSGAVKAVEFLKSSSKREYELTEREETLYHYYMGVLNYDMGNYSDAMIEFKKVDYIAEGVYSKLPLVALMRGLTYAKLGEIDNALVGFRKVMEQIPHSPIGYKLAILTETNQTNIDLYTRQLKDSCGVEYAKPGVDEMGVVTLIECKGELNKKNTTLMLTYNELSSTATLLDPVQPDFNFGAFAGGILKDIASKVMRDAAKNAAASIIPGGGILAGLFFGGDEKDTRAWQTAPDYFLADVVNLKKNSTYSIYAHNNETGATRTLSYDVKEANIVALNMICP